MDSIEKISCQYSHITDVGCMRDLNEDSVYCSDNLWLIADGMGGHACGEVASKLAVEEISSKYAQTGQLPAAIMSAHNKIFEVSTENTTQSGMGTTIVALANTDNNYQIAWVGDSRAYLWESKRQRLSQITEDHSLIVRLVKSKLISKKEAMTHPQRHMITQCLGSLDVAKIQVDMLQSQWKGNQQILLCSDGLTDEVSNEDLANILKQDISNQEKMTILVDIAKLAGGKDNISIILIDSPILEDPSIWNKLKSFFMKDKLAIEESDLDE